MASLTTPEDLANGIKAVVPGAKVKIETPAATAVSLPNMRGVSDQKTAKSVLGYAPKFNIVDGLRDLASWMKARRSRSFDGSGASGSLATKSAADRRQPATLYHAQFRRERKLPTGCP